MLSRSNFLALSAMLPATTTATYTLQSVFTAANWFSAFSVQSVVDPTSGFVNYVSQSQAQSSGIYKTINDQVFIGVDNSTVLDPAGTGRNSVRLASNDLYMHGLFIADFAHIPGSACGSWPAFWMVGPDWPTNGEINIIEGINSNSKNQIALHSSPGCDVTVGQYGQTGSSGPSNDCGAGGGIDGCTVHASSSTSYGTGFNNAGGGVFALEWASDSIKLWQWSKGQVPSDVTTGAPNPTGWGVPVASFAGCAFDNYLKQMNIMFDTTFCGDWAGNLWTSDAICSKLAPKCKDYAAQMPHAYDQTYWLINSLKVYQGL